MGKYFGTDGFRGEANVELTVEHAFKIGRFLGWYFGSEHKCRAVIGKDTRRSSYMIEDALSAGLTSSGADVYLLHVTPTPSVSYVVRTEPDFDFAIMITASHNPFYDNGIKLLNSAGEKMGSDVIDRLEKYLDGDTPKVPYAHRGDIGRTIDYSAGRNRYIGYLIALATRSFKNMRVGLDCSNGTAFMIAKNVFEALGARTFVINASPDGTNINLGCGSTHIEVLSEYVRANHLDVGFAYDGDADRCIAVDERGRAVNGDLILYICGKYMRERGQLAGDTVVTTVMSNIGLYKAFDREGIKYEKTAVGDRFVYQCMQENGYCLGGEQSGHIIFSKYATTGDGILTSIKLMEAMLESKQPLGKLCDDVDIYPQELLNIRVYDKQAAVEDAGLKEKIDKAEQILGTEGRVLVRQSGTEPLIRIMVEAKSQEQCLELANDMAAVLRKNGHVRED